MQTRDGQTHDPYVGPTDEELMRAPTVFRDGLLQGQVVLVSGGGAGSGGPSAISSVDSAPRSWPAGATR